MEQLSNTKLIPFNKCPLDTQMLILQKLPTGQVEQYSPMLKIWKFMQAGTANLELTKAYRIVETKIPASEALRQFAAYQTQVLARHELMDSKDWGELGEKALELFRRIKEVE